MSEYWELDLGFCDRSRVKLDVEQVQDEVSPCTDLDGCGCCRY